MKKGDRVQDRLTGSEWKIVEFNRIEFGRRNPIAYHVLVSDRGARRRVMPEDFEERYVKAYTR